MTITDPAELLGKGIYTIAEAKRLTGAKSDAIKRWMCGYQSQNKKGEMVERSPLWNAEIGIFEDEVALSFRDLMEVRFIAAFRRHGVRWSVVRAAAEFAEKEMGDSHPFSTKRFHTDGKEIFAENVENLQLNTKNFQYAMRDVIKRSFVAGIEFDGNAPVTWRPDGSRHIIIDPTKSFGKPILIKSGIPTSVIFNSKQVEKNTKIVAKIFDVTPAAVEAACVFEQRIA
jgi:uncharacterized protein (DUF433 family)